jgi:AcrR family transcriptional regulator
MARPREVDRLDIPARALEATMRLVAERGPEGVTLNEVAAAVGCRAPALYRYFPSRDALLLAAHNEGFHRLYATKLEVGEAARGDAFARLWQGGLSYVRFAWDNPRLYDLMFGDPAPFRRLAALQAAGDPAGEDFARRALGFLRDSILAVQAEGFLPGVDPDDAAFTFWATVHGAIDLALRRRDPFGEAATPDAAERAVEVVMGLVAATRPGEGGATDEATTMTGGLRGA